MEGTTRVTTEILNNKSDELMQIMKDLKTQYEEVQNIISASKSYWVGEAGDRLRALYSNLGKDVTEILGVLSEYPEKLQQMSGNYSSSHTMAIEKAEALPGDVI